MHLSKWRDRTPENCAILFSRLGTYISKVAVMGVSATLWEEVLKLSFNGNTSAIDSFSELDNSIWPFSKA
jgi:hypothetical protein